MGEPEFDFQPTAQAKEPHSITIDPRLWARLKEIADRHYEGSISSAISGLTLHEWMVELHRVKDGKGVNRHWISAPLILRPGELEPMLERMFQGDVDYVGSYFDERVKAAAAEGA